MDEQVPWAKLAKYIAEECSAREKREIEAWIDAKASRQELAEQLRYIWEAAEDSPIDEADSPLDLQSEWENLRSKAGSTGQSKEASLPSKSDASSHIAEQASSEPVGETRSRVFGAVVVLLVLAGGVLLAQHYRAPATNESSVNEYREVVTNRGEQASFQLSDGTEIKINADSKVRIPLAFGSETRTVKLTGEAYFDVASDSTRPFLVKTEDVTVDVLGTAFNVRNYSGDRTEVAVEEGSVALQFGGEHESQSEVRLEAGWVGYLLKRDTSTVTEKDDLSAHIGWTQGHLVFEKATLSEVATRLERQYDVEVIIQDSVLRSLQLTADLKSSSLHDVLDIISATLGVRYRIEKERVYLLS